MEKILDSKIFIKYNIVSFETAKLLKNIYNKICKFSWRKTNVFVNENDTIESIYDLCEIYTENEDNSFNAPDLFDVINFLADEYGFYINASHNNNGKWIWYFKYSLNEDANYTSENEYDTIQEALDMGIKVTIKDYIK